VTAADAHRAIDAVWRIESPKLIAGLTRIVRDVGLAEDLAQDALVAAVEQWPESGVPDNPGAWLMATAKHRAIDRLRRDERLDRKHEELGRELEAAQRMSTAVPESGGEFGDDLLRLVFIACHPVLSTEARVALTLRLLGGLTTDEIARAFLVPEPTIAQRIVRAKRTLTAARVPFDVPTASEMAARLDSVLEVIYLVFNEGYSATAGDDWMRPALCLDALRLGRLVAELLPREPETHGLVALMEIQASRTNARVGPGGEPILLLDQNRGQWDQLLIRRGLAALARAEELGGALGPYALQAAIAACHARARTAAETDWAQIAALYDALAQLAHSPVVELNRAVAYAMAFGPAAGLELADALVSEPSLRSYHLLPSVRGDLLAKLGRSAEARTEFERAAGLTRNARERELLLERAAACSRS
jgi:RNA polymerase sigma factor (sigma-70 family)